MVAAAQLPRLDSVRWLGTQAGTAFQGSTSDPPPPSPYPFPVLPPSAVYRGFWRDEVVAVKLIDCCFTSQAGSASAAELALHEAELSKSLQHPCVVKVSLLGCRAVQTAAALACAGC